MHDRDKQKRFSMNSIHLHFNIPLNFLARQPTKRTTIGFAFSSSETERIQKSFAHCPQRVILKEESLDNCDKYSVAF
jgi:hypothetical protein